MLRRDATAARVGPPPGGVGDGWHAADGRGEGVDEIATVTAVEGDNAPGVSVGDVIVKVDPRYFRPAEVETLLGDPAKAKEKLGWVPEITVEEMCAEMVEGDLQKAKQHALLKKHGYSVAVAKE